MKIDRHHTPMPRLKFRLYICLFVIALCLAGYATWTGLLDPTRRTGLLVSAMLTLFVITLVDLIPETIRRVSSRFQAARFRRLFGQAAVEKEVRLVFAHRELKPGVVDPWNFHHKVEHVGGEMPKAEGVKAWLSAQDVRASTYVASMIFNFTGRSVKIIHDKDIEHDDFDYCAIVFGLGFNGFTHQLANWCDGELFSIEWGASPKHGFSSPTDLFRIGSKLPSAPPGKDDAIVARIVPFTPEGQPRRVCFVCAGRTAPGTAVAGYYLAHHWEDLLKLYESYGKNLKTDSLAVVVRHSAGQQDFDSTGEIALDGDVEFAQWGKASGVV